MQIIAHKLMKKNTGFTLIEVIIYLALFSIVIGGGMVATYQIIQSKDSGANHVIMEDEANFLLRKINWALTGATPPISPLPASTLTVSKSGTNYTFDLNSNNLRLNNIVLNSSSIKVSNLSFTSPGTNGITTSFTLETMQEGRKVTQPFSTTKYLRSN
jgi:prepilin-type N-terminal cleavage/methylation domain-containing protein